MGEQPTTISPLCVRKRTISTVLLARRAPRQAGWTYKSIASAADWLLGARVATQQWAALEPNETAAREGSDGNGDIEQSEERGECRGG